MLCFMYRSVAEQEAVVTVVLTNGEWQIRIEPMSDWDKVLPDGMVVNHKLGGSWI